MKLVFLCKGSRGDVAPILALAVGFKETTHSVDTCVLATHTSHRKKFDEVLEKHGIGFLAIDATEDEKKVDEKREVDKTEINVSMGRGFSNEERQHRLNEMHRSLRACHGADAIVFNLFTCEGWFIAQYLGVPCIAASPFAITRSPPVTFESKFSNLYPELYQLLREASSGQVSYSEVDHWMWRLYLDDFGEFCHTLGLPVCPFANVRVGDQLPKATQLLYGISPRVIDQQGYWPESISLCGYWSVENPDDTLKNITVRCPSYNLTASFLNLPQFIWELNKNKERLVFISFGSMEELGFFSSLDTVKLLGTLNEGLVECGMQALIQLGNNSPLLKTWDMLCKNVKNCNMYCVHGYLSHALLFPHCHVIVHHGGSGTVGSSLRAGVPQIICPFMFDQSYWADKITSLGLGQSMGHPRSLTAPTFADALRKVSSPDIQHNATQYGKLLEKEDGVGVAVKHINKALGR